MSRQQLFFIFFVALLLFIVSQVVLIFSPFLRPLFWAAILAFACYPVYARTVKGLRGARSLAALLVTVGMFLAFVPLVVFIITSLATEAAGLYHWAQQAVSENRIAALLDQIRALPAVQRLRELAFSVDIVHAHYREWSANALSEAGGFIARQAADLTRTVILGPFNLFLTFFLVFFMLRDGARIQGFFYDITPMEDADKRHIYSEVTGTFEAVIRGQLLTAVAQGLLAGVIFWALGLPLPILFASLTFVASLVPLFGSALIWSPLVVYLLLHQAYGRAIALLLLGIFGISLVDNFLKPMLIGEKTKLPYLVLFLGILGGLKVYGLMGMFLAPTVLSLFFVLVKIYREKFLSPERPG